MIKTKLYYAQRVILGLQDDYPNLDFKIQEREVFPVVDDIVNRMAEADYFDNWKFTGQHVAEHFVTTWPEVVVTDQDNELPSYFDFPSNYVELPKNRGIDEIWPLKFRQNSDDHSVIIMTHQEYRRFKSQQAGGLQGRLGGYPQGTRFYFTSCGVKKKYGNVGLRLVIRSAADITDTAAYPVPANKEGEVIALAIKYFVMKRTGQTDQVRDAKDVAA